MADALDILNTSIMFAEMYFTFVAHLASYCEIIQVEEGLLIWSNWWAKINNEYSLVGNYIIEP